MGGGNSRYRLSVPNFRTWVSGVGKLCDMSSQSIHLDAVHGTDLVRCHLRTTCTLGLGTVERTEKDKQDRTERMVLDAIEVCRAHPAFDECKLRVFANPGSYANNTNVLLDSRRGRRRSNAPRSCTGARPLRVRGTQEHPTRAFGRRPSCEKDWSVQDRSLVEGQFPKQVAHERIDRDRGQFEFSTSRCGCRPMLQLHLLLPRWGLSHRDEDLPEERCTHRQPPGPATGERSGQEQPHRLRLQEDRSNHETSVPRDG